MMTVPPRNSAGPTSIPAGATASRRPEGGVEVVWPVPLIARDNDLAWLEGAAPGGAKLVGARIVGDVGVGKSRLLAEFLNAADAAGDVVVQTGPDPAWAEVGYWALRHAIARLAELPLGWPSRDWVAATAEARQGLADVFGTAARDKANGSSRPRNDALRPPRLSSWAIVRANERAHGHRVVLAVDDLHAIDGASCNAFSDALGDPPLSPRSSWPRIHRVRPRLGRRHGRGAGADSVAHGAKSLESPFAKAGQPSSPCSRSAHDAFLSMPESSCFASSREESGGVPSAGRLISGASSGYRRGSSRASGRCRLGRRRRRPRPPSDAGRGSRPGGGAGVSAPSRHGQMAEEGSHSHPLLREVRSPRFRRR